MSACNSDNDCFSVQPASTLYIDTVRSKLRGSLRLLLDPTDKINTPELPLTYEKIYAGCRFITGEAGRGEETYDMLKMELEKCVGRLALELKEDRKAAVEWVVPFNKACGWFQKQIVSLPILAKFHDMGLIVI
jgi:cullin 4